MINWTQRLRGTEFFLFAQDLCVSVSLCSMYHIIQLSQALLASVLEVSGER